jgi:transcriptional regulator with XRE-family HTH domain
MNWPDIIKSIMERGLSQHEIARELGSTQGNISNLLCGRVKEPGHALGQALIQLERNTRRRKPGSKK